MTGHSTSPQKDPEVQGCKDGGRTTSEAAKAKVGATIGTRSKVK
jgi:hypothetical protein